MSVSQILDVFLGQELPRSVQIFGPELVLCATIIVLLLARMLEWHRRFPTSMIALLGSLIAFLGVFSQFMYLKTVPDEGLLSSFFAIWQLTPEGSGTAGPYFSGLLMHDPFGIFFRLGLTLFLVLVIVLTVLSGIPDDDDGQDFYSLLIGSTIGMMMAVSANHLLMLFLAVEMMSVPSYVLVAFQKGRKQAGEAALKYVVYGAGAAGVMLYGISLIAGLLGTGLLPELGERLVVVLGEGSLSATDPKTLTLVLAVLMVMAGLAFKLSLVPFHFWCPDAFEGASSEVCAFLSVASKAAAFALLVRFVLAFHGAAEALQQLSFLFGMGLGLIAIITMTYGNLAAYTQENLKRLLAYSTIAHAGYMIMAVAAMMIILSSHSVETNGSYAAAVQCLEGLIYYIGVYLFMNLVAFGVIALIRNQVFSEEIDSFNGLFQSDGATRVLCVCLAISFFSLVGLPPFGGFFAKLELFYSALVAGNIHWLMWVVLVVGGINAVFSLFYYVRVMKAIFFNSPPEGRRPLQIPASTGVYFALITLPILALGASPLMSKLSSTAQFVAFSLFH